MDTVKGKVKPVEKLQPLKLYILDHGAKVRTVEIPDPRVLYMEEYNRRALLRGSSMVATIWN